MILGGFKTALLTIVLVGTIGISGAVQPLPSRSFGNRTVHTTELHKRGRHSATTFWSPTNHLVNCLSKARHHATSTEVSVVICFAAVCIIAFCFVSTKWGNHFPKTMVSVLACVFYVSISVMIDMSIFMQKQGSTNQGQQYGFEPSVAVLMTEMGKLVISAAIATFSVLSAGSFEATTVSMKSMVYTDMLWFCLPAAFFTLNNVLVWWAISKTDPSTFGVLRDTMILWTALIWRTVFHQPLGIPRLCAITLIFCGCVLNQAPALLSNKMASSWGALWVLAMTLCNALGSVANEFAMKRTATIDINLQNMILYAACVTFTLPLICLRSNFSHLMENGIFTGFTQMACFTIFLQIVAGLCVSRILKYADSIMKNVAGALRGPLLVMIATVFFPNSYGPETYMSVVLVAAGCVAYLTQGPLK